MSVTREMVVGPRTRTVTSKEPSSSDLTEDDLRRLYRLMALTRAVDEKAWTLNRQGRLPFVASCRGHEAAQVGSAMALKPGFDVVFTYYRDIGVALTLGMEPRDLFFSSFGKPTVVNGSSRHLPWHLIHKDLKLMPVTSVVGTQIPQAAGAALASKLRGDGAVTIVYFGDGATSEGDFHEGMNWAGIHKLPIVFFCQNNGYAISVPLARQMGVVSVAERAKAYGFDGVTVDGTDPEEVYRATRMAVDTARDGGGPTLVEAKLRRLRPHSSDDDDRRYLSEEEREALQRHDPMDALRQRFLRRGILDEANMVAIDAEVKGIAERAADEAEHAPDARAEDILRHVFAESPGNPEPGTPNPELA
jgi:2-oxoisovalerate dehydrogenase E1 component alpha subunit